MERLLPPGVGDIPLWALSFRGVAADSFDAQFVDRVGADGDTFRRAVTVDATGQLEPVEAIAVHGFAGADLMSAWMTSHGLASFDAGATCDFVSVAGRRMVLIDGDGLAGPLVVALVPTTTALIIIRADSPPARGDVVAAVTAHLDEMDADDPILPPSD